MANEILTQIDALQPHQKKTSTLPAGPSLPAPRCRVETSTFTRARAVTGSRSWPSAEDVWCAKTAFSCAPRALGSSIHSACSPTTSTRRWCREKRCDTCHGSLACSLLSVKRLHALNFQMIWANSWYSVFCVLLYSSWLNRQICCDHLIESYF